MSPPIISPSIIPSRTRLIMIPSIRPITIATIKEISERLLEDIGFSLKQQDNSIFLFSLNDVTNPCV